MLSLSAMAVSPSKLRRNVPVWIRTYGRRAGGRCTSFPTIVGVGPRAALPHCPPGQHRVGESELLLIDWGASGRFYKSDLTRVLLPRKTSRLSARDVEPKVQEVYDI